AADADMENVADRAERLRLDRIDQRPHPEMETLRHCDALRRALSPLGGVLGGAPLARIDDLAREQRIALGCAPRLAGQQEESGEGLLGKMGLGEIEMQAGLVEAEASQPV